MAKQKKKGQASRAGVPPEPASPKGADRRGLWVVMASKMKQYGDLAIERPGQVIRQQYLRNDDLLLKHSYVKPLQDQEDMRQCEACGLMFIGSVTAGPYKAHLEYARHDLATLDLDAGTAAKDGRRPRVGDAAANPDVDDSGEWDLEPDGAPGEEKLEKERPGGVRVSLGSR